MIKEVATILIDDEPGLRVYLEDLLRASHPEVRIIAEASNIQEAKTLIENLKPDLVFLDIEMPGGSGFDLLKSIGT